MNTDRVFSLIKSRFPQNLRFLSPRVVRAEKMYRDILIGILYFDLSQGAGHGDFELSDYLQRYLARDYYSHEGSLQWNYYLYFVMEKDSLRSLREAGKASTIESDRTFARKFVTDEAWLEEELLGTPTAELLAARPPADLVSAWTEKPQWKDLAGSPKTGSPTTGSSKTTFVGPRMRRKEARLLQVRRLPYTSEDILSRFAYDSLGSTRPSTSSPLGWLT